MKKIISLILFFYLLVLFQSSFFTHFPLKGYVLNFVLVAVILINFFEGFQKKIGIFSALLGGFFLDIYSENFFGFWVLILITVSLFIKYILKEYIHPVIRIGG